MSICKASTFLSDSLLNRNTLLIFNFFASKTGFPKPISVTQIIFDGNQDVPSKAFIQEINLRNKHYCIKKVRKTLLNKNKTAQVIKVGIKA